MPDPLQVLRLPNTPAEPDPGFASTLRARLARALDPTGARVSALTPYLAVNDARRAMGWYGEVFGARVDGQPYDMPDGRIGHAELLLGEQRLMLSDAYPEIGVVAPTGAGTSVSLHLSVSDVDAVTAAARDAGAEVVRPPADQPYGRSAALLDPFGHRWMVMTPPGAVAPPSRVDYLTIATPDVPRTKAFFGALLGWRFTPGSVPDGWQVEGLTPPAGLWGGAAEHGVSLTFSVDDVAAAVKRVRELGGAAGEPAARPYGLLADCADDQGVGFSLLQPTPR